MSAFLFYILTLILVLFFALPIFNNPYITPINVSPEEIGRFFSEILSYWKSVFFIIKK